MDLKSFRHYGDEMEVLGQRLDAARNSLSGARSAWAKNYWQQVITQLEFQWRQLPILHDADARMTIIPRYTIDYNFYEKAEEIGRYDFVDKFYDAVFNHSVNLDASWEAHRAARLAKAQ